MDYRLYFLDGEGHIQQASDIEAADDEDAKARARSLSDGRAMELWCRAEIVERFPADAQADEPETWRDPSGG